jgi:hypothetical protein
MSIEERLRSGLADGLAGFDPGPGDRQAVEALGRRFRRRRRVAGGAAAMALVALAAVAVAVPGLGGDGDARPDPAPAPQLGGTWRDLPAAPIDGRWGAVGAWTGTEAVFVGGAISRPCPPNADCTDPEVIARDGAAYDPVAGSWCRIADAPVPVGYWFRTTAVDGQVVLYGSDGESSGHWLAYDPTADRWRELPPPPRAIVDWGEIPSYDGKVYAISRSDTVLVLDVATQTWSELPASTEEPRLDLRTVLPTDRGVFVSGFSGPEAELEYTLVEKWDGTQWTRLPVTGQVDTFQYWTGDHLINTDPQTANGEADSPPMGGRLDVHTGEWSPIPGNPSLDAPRPPGWTLNAAGGSHVVSWGHDYDDSTGTFTAFGKPDSDVDDSQAAVWANDRMIVFGGADDETAYQEAPDGKVRGLSHDAWSWTP